MEGTILDVVSFLENVDFTLIFKVMGMGLIVFWLVLVVWTFFDASARFSSPWMRIFSVVVVIILPLFGILIYLLIRPGDTVEEGKWIDRERRFLAFESAGLEDCPRCGYELMPNFLYCPNCNLQLRVKCETCEVYIEPEWHACPFCGTEQKATTRLSLVTADAASTIKDEETAAPKISEKEMVKPVEKEPEQEKEQEPETKQVADVASSDQPHKEAATDTSEQSETPAVTKQPDTSGSKPVPPRTAPAQPSFFKRGVRNFAIGVDGFVQYIGAIPLKLVKKKPSPSGKRSAGSSSSKSTSRKSPSSKKSGSSKKSSSTSSASSTSEKSSTTKTAKKKSSSSK